MKALGPIGQAVEGVGQIAGGVSAYGAGKYTRKVMRINARNAQTEGLMERGQIRLASRLQMGRQIVDQGSSGFAVGTGSALDALKESAIARELDLMTSRFNSQGRADAYTTQGDLEFAKGKSALVGGIISGAASLIGAASTAFGPPGGGA